LKLFLRLLFLPFLAGCGRGGSSGGGAASGPAGGSLPAGWQAKDVGAPALGGSTAYAGGVFSLTGSGSDIWGVSDAFQFSYVPMSGDVEITARVLHLDPTDAWAKAGVMIRETLDAGSRFAMTVVTPSNGALLQFRESPGGNADALPGLMMAAPLWVRLRRSGDTFSADVSGDGASWTSLGTRTISMAADVQVGLCLTSHTNAATASASFDGVTESGGAPAGLPAPWSTQDIGIVGAAGSADVASGTFTVCGSGADIWGTSDAFRFVSQPMSGDGQLTARVGSLTNTDGWAKAGVMIRETLDPSSRFAMVVTTPSNGTTFQYRTSTAGAAALQSGMMQGPPAWVRISRSANTFSGAVSTDGASWTSIGTADIAMGATVYVGLCVTAHNNAATAWATIGHVELGASSPPPPPPSGSLTVSSPASRIVYQRNNSNTALVRIAGTCAGVSRVEARLVARQGGIPTAWTTIDDSTPGAYAGTLTGTGGWYQLEVRGLSGASVVATASVDRVGVGEVFVVVGHSVAHTGVDNIAGASDDRVNTIPLLGGAMQDNYTNTGDPQYLPRAFGQYGSGVSPAPFGGNNYFWARFAEILAQRRIVPVIVYNAAFGGTSLEHWAKSSQGILFEHGFVNSSIRMPYINLYNALKTLVQSTGVRAILADQGANDWPNPDEDQVLGYYQRFVDQARADLGHGALAVVVNRATPFMTVSLIRRVQERMIATSNCFAGPDYDTLAPEDRYDGTHLSLAGQSKAAQMWSDALTDGFFASSQPWVP
jgi:regulation of enolase protein 1 (concanavalin A-like superfamily)